MNEQFSRTLHSQDTSNKSALTVSPGIFSLVWYSPVRKGLPYYENSKIKKFKFSRKFSAEKYEKLKIFYIGAF